MPAARQQRRHRHRHQASADALAPVGGYPGNEEQAAQMLSKLDAADVGRIKASLLIRYAANDERINAGWPAYEAALESHGVRYEMFMYPSTNHGFHNDTTPRYDEAAATLAWARMIAFFDQKLRN